MLSLKDRLLSAEDDFFSTLANGEDAMRGFATRWEQLMTDVDSTMEASGLDDNMAMLVHATALRIATYVEASTEVYESYNTLTAELVDQIDNLMSDIRLTDPATPAPHSPSSSYSAPSLSRAHKRPRTRSPSLTPPVSSKRRCHSHISPVYNSGDAGSSTPSTTIKAAVNTTPSSRKRRLSEADGSPVPPPSKRIHIGPRVHAVSDSYPGSRVSGHGQVVDPSPFIVPVALDQRPDALSREVPVMEPSGSVDINSFFDSANLFTSRTDMDAIDAFLSSLLQPHSPATISPRPPVPTSARSGYPTRNPHTPPSATGHAHLTPAIDLCPSHLTAKPLEADSLVLFENDWMKGMGPDSGMLLPRPLEPVDDRSYTDWNSLFDSAEPLVWHPVLQQQNRPLSPLDCISDTSSDSDDDTTLPTVLLEDYLPLAQAEVSKIAIVDTVSVVDTEPSIISS